MKGMDKRTPMGGKTVQRSNFRMKGAGPLPQYPAWNAPSPQVQKAFGMNTGNDMPPSISVNDTLSKSGSVLGSALNKLRSKLGGQSSSFMANGARRRAPHPFGMGSGTKKF